MQHLPEDFAVQLRLAIIKHENDPYPIAQEIANLVNEAAERNVLIMHGANFAPVLTDSELAHMDRILSQRWLSAKNVWLALRAAEPYEHGISIRLGKQLSARYPKQRKQGATRLYWIAPPTIAKADA